MARKEGFGTTGTRLLVRVFGGFDFNTRDLEHSDARTRAVSCSNCFVTSRMKRSRSFGNAPTGGHAAVDQLASVGHVVRAQRSSLR